MKKRLNPSRTARYYYLRFLRLKGDPRAIARGVALGTFVGITPTLPLHTIAILVAAPILRANLVAALLAATVVSNPLTFGPQYYASWLIGDMLAPCHVSWNTIQATLGQITGGDLSFQESLAAVWRLGSATLLTLVTGGIVLAAPIAAAAYFWSYRLVRRFQQRRAKRHLYSR